MTSNRDKFRCFKRTNWRTNKSWPNGLEPQAIPMDECRTLATFDSEEEAREFCRIRNAKRPKREPNRSLSACYEYTRV